MAPRYLLLRMGDPSLLIIPVENQVRELDAKLLLACVAVERGYPVVLGSRAFIHYGMHAFPRGVYVAKSMRKLSERMFRIIRQLGHEIVAFDEEGLVRLIDEEYYAARLSPKTVPLVSHLLAWGPDDARVFEAYPASRGVPIHVTGNPRTDMLRRELRGYLEPEQRALRERYGDFVLINSNFAEVNHFVAKLSAARRLAEGAGLAGTSEWARARARFRVAIHAAFEEMVPALAEALPDVTIVLRLHPSESRSRWRDLTARFDRVHVIHEGSVLPWLLASCGMVQNGCATAVEGHMLGVPVLGYHPIVDERYDDPLPKGFAHECRDLDSLIAAVRDAGRGKLGPREDPECRAIVERHLAATTGRLGADRMIDVLDQAGYRDAAPPRAKSLIRGVASLHNRIRSVEKRFKMHQPGHRNHWSFHLHRFPELSLDDVQRRVDRLAGLLDRFHCVRIERESRFVFRLQQSL